MSLRTRPSTRGSAFGAVVSTGAVFALVVLLTRVVGPRSLPEMSSFDLTCAVATGASLASTSIGVAEVFA